MTIRNQPSDFVASREASAEKLGPRRENEARPFLREKQRIRAARIWMVSYGLGYCLSGKLLKERPHPVHFDIVLSK